MGSGIIDLIRNIRRAWRNCCLTLSITIIAIIMTIAAIIGIAANSTINLVLG